MQSNEKTNFLIVFFISFFFTKTCFTSSAQTAGQTIKGSVFDIDSHEPLLGATIVLAESDSLLGTTSDKNGKFSPCRDFANRACHQAICFLLRSTHFIKVREPWLHGKLSPLYYFVKVA